MAWQVVIGLEVHIQLNTKTKLFCSCANDFGAEPNTNTCPVCLGHPGTLPVLNQKASKKAIKAGLATNCTINTFSKFDRKNYFYPDLPKAYQISQYNKPIASDGYLKIKTKNNQEKKIGINRIHIEEDAGKLIHAQSKQINESYVDLNRAGTPLIEVVSEPHLNSVEEVTTYLEELKKNMLYIDVSNCNMEEGSLRCDANISIKQENETKLGNRTEIKNMNTFKGLSEAIQYEIKRQINLLEKGQTIQVETLLWDTEVKKTKSIRSKEKLHDYRYFPEPDLLPCVLTQKEIDTIKDNLEELPKDKKNRFIKNYYLSDYDATVLSSDKHLADYYEKAVAFFPKKPKKICNWITTEILSILNEKLISINDFSVKAEHIGMLIKLISEGDLSGKIAKDIFPEMIETQKSPLTIMKEKNLKVVSDQDLLKKIAIEIIKKNQNIVEKYKNGNKKVLGFLIGQAMKKTKGQANPNLINKIILQLIEKN